MQSTIFISNITCVPVVTYKHAAQILNHMLHILKTDRQINSTLSIVSNVAYYSSAKKN